jgi:uncharacterized MnhB-related membrane protein
MIDVLLIAMLLFFAALTLRARRLLSSALWLAAVSAILAVLFFRLGAPQVAVIELSVGAGLVTVLFVFAISVAGDDVIAGRVLLPWSLALLLVLAMMALLGWLLWPVHGTTTTVVEPSLAEIVWQVRGLDMLVQVVLIFCGVLGVLGLLAEARAPLEQAVAAEVAARRERELLALQQKALQ